MVDQGGEDITWALTSFTPWEPMKRSTREDLKNQVQSEIPQHSPGKMRLASVGGMTRRKRAERYHERLNEAFLQLTSDFDWNINLITKTCGELLGPNYALYNRLRNGHLYSLGRWQIPEDLSPIHKPNGHICYDVIKRGMNDGAYMVKNLQETSYVETDPNVIRYGLKTYAGHPVFCFGKSVGSLCSVYQEDVEFDENDKRILGILAKAIGIEEERKQVEEGRRGESREGDRLKLAEQLHQGQGMEALGTLAGGIAHDLKNLLTVIQGDASLMLLDIDPSHPHYERLESIEQQVESATELIGQLLRFTEDRKYNLKPTDLNDLLEKISEMFARTKRGIKIHIEYQKDLWTAEVDQSQIERVFLNLYMNAWQAMPGGGNLYLETKNIVLDDRYCEAHGVETGRYVKVSVTDTGVGMDETTQQRIFEPFFTTNEVNRGTGLGLASVYGIIKNHGGVIEVCSKKTEGSTFNLYFPASEKDFAEEKNLSRGL